MGNHQREEDNQWLEGSALCRLMSIPQKAGGRRVRRPWTANKYDPKYTRPAVRKPEIIIFWSRFPLCVLSYFSLVFIMEHSRRWWLLLLPISRMNPQMGSSAVSIILCQMPPDIVPRERNPCVALSRLAPHCEDEIISLKKQPFLASFVHVTHIYRHDMDILQKNCPQLAFPSRSEDSNILVHPWEGCHRLLNWQIQI